MNPRLRLAISLVITTIFLTLLFTHVDVAKVAGLLKSLSPGAVCAALICLATGCTLRIVRWWVMLKSLDPNVRMADCAWPFLVGITANNLLPFRAGDAIRILAFRRQLGAPVMRILGTVLLERTLDLLALAGLLFILLGQIDHQGGGLNVQVFIWIGAGGLLLLCALLWIAPQVHGWFSRMLTRSTFSRRSWAKTLDTHATHLVQALSVMRSPLMFTRLTGLTLVSWVFDGGVFVIVALSLAPDLASSSAPWFAMATGTLSTLIPSGPGYFGTFDYFTMLGFRAFGAPQDVATAFALAVHLIQWLPLTLMGGVYFLRPAGRALYSRARSKAA